MLPDQAGSIILRLAGCIFEANLKQIWFKFDSNLIQIWFRFEANLRGLKTKQNFQKPEKSEERP